MQHSGAQHYKRLSIVAEPTDLVRARQKAVESRLHHLILILLPQPPPHQAPHCCAYMQVQILRLLPKPQRSCSQAEQNFWFKMIRIALHTKVGVIGLVYRKSLRLTPASKAHHTEGEIVNLMQQDSERLMWFIPMSPNLISCSLQVALNSLLLFYYIGVTAVVGIIMLACLIPINRVLVGMQ